MTDPETALPDWLKPLRQMSAKKHASTGIKNRPTDPSLTKAPPRCAISPNKMRFATMEDAISYRIGADPVWLTRTEPYECRKCVGVHIRTKRGSHRGVA